MTPEPAAGPVSMAERGPSCYPVTTSLFQRAGTPSPVSRCPGGGARSGSIVLVESWDGIHAKGRRPLTSSTEGDAEGRYRGKAVRNTCIEVNYGGQTVMKLGSRVCLYG